ncbi:MAG: hypothetical protein NT080_03585 [Spirochaetes bacterium]|nr:hypothetical protein [Spirochaetota bacterium]
MPIRKKSDDTPELSNAQIKRLLDQTMTRFENWRIEMERNPNPMMVHSLRNVVSIVDSLSTMVGNKMEYSYKELVERMARLTSDTARLNMTIVQSLKDDDLADEAELKKISGSLLALVNSAVALAKMVQDAFGSPSLVGPHGRAAIAKDAGTEESGRKRLD